jgi:dihydrofolate synthase/folylpolyglutamate synthase
MMGHNAALAWAAMELSGAAQDAGALGRGLETAFAPGRFQIVRAQGREFIVDGAHNGPAAEVLAATLRAHLGDRAAVLVTGMVQGHEPESFYRPLEPWLERVVVAPIDFHRAVPPAELAARLGPHARVAASVPEAISRAVEASAPGQAIVVTGSFYLAGEVLSALGAGPEG